MMRGSNHTGMRQFNERIVLQAIRHHGAIAKADLARVTQLPAQTVAIIVGRLIEDGLLLKQARVHGKIGQPSVPLALNPDGAFSLCPGSGRRIAATAHPVLPAQGHFPQTRFSLKVIYNHP